MKTACLILLTALTAQAASAQVSPAYGGGVELSTGNAIGAAMEANPLGGTHVTPRMEWEQLMRAKALRQNVSAMMASNGGDLSPSNLAYIRRESCRIRMLTGMPRSC